MQASGVLERAGVPIIDERSAADALGGGRNEAVLLFFPGDPAQRPEAADVAVIFPELLGAFQGRLRGAVVALGAERALGQVYHVDVFPSLAVIRAGVTIGVIPRVRDWADYLQKIEAFLDPAAQPLAQAAPRVAITSAYKGATA
jgi:hydrogenase-1 operon protein HyaE